MANVSSEKTNAQGSVEGAVTVWLSVSTNSPRVPEKPEVPNGSDTEAIWPVPTVKVVDLPITVPVELANEIEPVHDAALDDAEAMLTTLT